MASDKQMRETLVSEIQAAQNLQITLPDQADGLMINFKTIQFPDLPGSPNATLSYAEDINPVSTKLIFHVKDVSLDAMVLLGVAMQKFCVEVLHQLPVDIRAEAGESPIFRGQWDFIIWDIPTLRTTTIQNLAIQTLLSVGKNWKEEDLRF